MKFYTKTWYSRFVQISKMNTKEAMEVVRDMNKRYLQATQHMQSFFSDALRDALYLYDAILIAQYWDGGKYVLEFEPHGMSDTTKLVFSGIDELRGDESLTGFITKYIEEYAYDDKFEIHMLFIDFTEEGEVIPKELIISAREIEYELRDRSWGV